MSDYAGWLNNGSTGPEALGKLWAKLFTPGIALVLNPTAYQVTQRAAGTNMSVDIAVGTGLENATDYDIPIWSNATINVVVTAADPSNPRNDIVVAYIDLTAYGANNNVGATKFIIVSGTPSGSPSDPSDASIQTAVGTGNPWMKLARIAVPANAPSVVDAYITDLRPPIAFAGNLWGGSSNTKGHIVPNVADDTVALLAAAQTFTDKTIDGGSNTLQNIPFAALLSTIFSGQVQTFTNTGSGGGTGYYVNVGGLKLLWCSQGTSMTTGSSWVVNYPASFFTNETVATYSVATVSATPTGLTTWTNGSTGISSIAINTATSGTAFNLSLTLFVIGT